MVAWEVSKEVAERTGSLLLPLLPYGFSDDHFPMAGTLSIGADTLIHIVEDIATSLQISGVKHLVIVSGHAGHLTQLEDVAYRVPRSYRKTCRNVYDGIWSRSVGA